MPFIYTHNKLKEFTFKLTLVGCDGGITEDWTPEFILVGKSTASDFGITELLAAGVEAFTVSVEAEDATEETSLDCVVVVTIDDSAEFTVCDGMLGVLSPTTFFFGGCFLLAGVKSTSCKRLISNLQ